LAGAQAFSVVEVSDKSDFAGEEAGRAAHQENQNCEDNRSYNHGYAHAEFRPPELLLARQLSVVLDKNHNRKRFDSSKTKAS
jgi:hypothetical protein